MSNIKAASFELIKELVETKQVLDFIVREKENGRGYYIEIQIKNGYRTLTTRRNKNVPQSFKSLDSVKNKISELGFCNFSVIGQP